MTAPSSAHVPAPHRLRIETLEPVPAAAASPEAPSAPPAPTRAARGFRRGVVTIACELRTPRVMQFYRRDFTPISHWLDGLDRARDFRHVVPRTVNEAEQAIAAHLAAVQAVFNEAVQRADALLVAQGLANVPIRYAAPVTVAAPIVHPVAHAYLRLLAVADDAFSGVERAWLLGLIDTRHRRHEEARFRKALRGIATIVREQYSALARVLREPRGPAAHVGDAGETPGASPLTQGPPPGTVATGSMGTVAKGMPSVATACVPETDAQADVAREGRPLPWWQASAEGASTP